MDNKAIDIQNLVIDYGNSIAVNDISLQVEKGELVTLLGPSGCGKSTTLNALAGLITATSGKIYFDGRNVTRFSPKERDIGLVFQSYALYPHMTVYKNISFPLLVNKKFQKQVEKENETIDFEILKLKYKIAGKKDFATIAKPIFTYNKISEELAEELNVIDYKTNNATKNAKEQKSVIRLRRNGKIKNISEEALSFIEKNEELMAEIKKQAESIKESNISKEQKDIEINKLRETIEKIETANSEKYEEHNRLIKEVKIQAIEDTKFAASEKKRILGEVKVWRIGEINKINEKIRSNDEKYKEAAQDAMSTIKSIAKTAVPNEAEQNIIKELEDGKLSWKLALDKKVRAVAERVGITDQLEKKVTALSGGQQQRVAISRTLVKNPKILLLDEPLSNLDAKMRVSTREWIRNLQQDLGITTVFVTHDQEEAMSISDKIVCMSNGLIQQIAEPMDLYENPVNKFVAGFLGMPQMNFIELETPIGTKLDKLTKFKNVHTFGIRPEHIKIKTELKASEVHALTLDAEIVITESFGREKLVTAKVGEEIIKFFTEVKDLERGDKTKLVIKKKSIYGFDNVDLGNTIGKK